MTSACNIIDVVSGVVISIAAIVVAFLTCKYKRLVPIYAMFMVVTIVFPQAFALNWLSGIAYSGRLTRARAFSASVLTVCGWRVLPWLVVVAVEGILSAFLCQSSISMATAFADGAAIALKVYLVANAIGYVYSVGVFTLLGKNDFLNRRESHCCVVLCCAVMFLLLTKYQLGGHTKGNRREPDHYGRGRIY